MMKKRKRREPVSNQEEKGRDKLTKADILIFGKKDVGTLPR